MKKGEGKIHLMGRVDQFAPQFAKRHDQFRGDENSVGLNLATFNH